MKLLPLILIFSLLSLVQGIANPIITNAMVEKTWEKCIVAVSSTKGFVSCAVGYKVLAYSDEPIHIDVPLILKSSYDHKDILRDKVIPTIEMNGVIYKAKSSSVKKSLNLPKGLTRFDCSFVLPPIKQGEFSLAKPQFSMVVSYQQDLSNGVFYYLPLFEQGESKQKPRSYSFTAFATEGVSLNLSSQHAEIAASMKTRITVTPKHKELIIIKTN